MAFKKIVATQALKPGRAKAAFCGATKVSVWYLDGQYFAAKNFCPHAGAALSPGKVSGLVVECPRHSWKFNVATGKCLTSEMFCLTTYPTQVKDGYVWVDTGAAPKQ